MTRLRPALPTRRAVGAWAGGLLASLSGVSGSLFSGLASMPAQAQPATPPAAGPDGKPAAPAPFVQLGGVMGGKALLLIDGQPQMVAVGQTVQGIRLVSIQGDQAQVERGGTTTTLRVGGSPAAVGAGFSRPGAPREISIPVGPGGHFTTVGTINGQAVNFMVDTGATFVALSQADAVRLGVDLKTGQRGVSQTANGPVPVVGVVLNSIKVGEIEIFNVQAVVMPAAMGHVLLGNSFLSRFTWRRDSDVLRLEQKR